jgi:hypothetical protein
VIVDMCVFAVLLLFLLLAVIVTVRYFSVVVLVGMPMGAVLPFTERTVAMAM